MAAKRRDPVIGASPPVLQRALNLLATELDEQAAETGLAADELFAHLQVVSGALGGDGSAADPAKLTAAQTAILQLLLDRLRTLIPSLWAADRDPATAPELLDLLVEVDRIRASLRTDDSRDAFASLLASAHGPDLLVELAHDLRSPLTSVLFLAETLWRGQSGALNEIQLRQLGIIYSAALSLISLAGDVIELARGGDRLMERHPTPFSIEQLFESIRDLVRPMTEERGITLRTVSAGVDQRVGFPVALSRVLLNLTTNAIKFTERGSVDLVARTNGPDRIEFSVRDDGKGIADEEIPHLYKPFRTRASSERLAFSGTGLGLSICRKLLGAMGTQLEMETTRGIGTRFHFELELPPAER